MWTLSIQNDSKPSITKKRTNKAKYLTWNSKRLKFVKKTSIPNPVKSLGYIKCHSSRSLRAVKSPSNSNSVPIHDICLVLNKVDRNWVVRICRILFLKKSLVFHNLVLFNKTGKNKWCFFNQKKLYYRESCKSLELYMYYKGYFIF